MSDAIDTVAVEVVADFNQLDSSIRSTMSSASRSIDTQLNGAFRRADRQLTEFGRSVSNEAGDALEDLADTGRDAADDIDRAFNDVDLDELDTGLNELDREFDEVADAAEDATTEIERDFDQAADKIDDDFDRIKRSSNQRFGDAADNVDRQTGRMSGSVKKAAGAMAAAFAAISIGSWAVDAVQGAFEVERQLTEVVNVATAGVGDPALFVELNELSGDLAVEFGLLTDDILPAFYNAVSAGVQPGQELEAALTAAAQGARVNLTDLDTALNATTTALNIFADDGLTAQSAMDVFTATVNSGKTTLDELGPALSGPSAVAVQLGIGLDQVGGAFAAMTAQGVGTAEASTQIRAAFTELGDSTTTVGKLFEETAGQSFQQFIEGGGTVAEASRLVAAAAEESGQSLNQVFSSVEGASAAFFLSTEEGGAKFADVMSAVREEGSLTETAFDSLSETGAFTMDQLRASLEQLQLGVGAALGPAVIEIVNALLPLIDELAPIFASIAGVVGEVLAAVFEAISPLLPVIAQLVDTLLPPLARAFMGMLDAISPLIGMVAELISGALERLAPVLEPIIDVAIELSEIIAGALAAVFPIIIDLVLTLLDAILPLIPSLLDLVKAFLPLLPPIIQLISALLPPLVMLIESLLVPFISLIEPIIKLQTTIIGALVDAGLVPLIEIIAQLLVPLLEFLVLVLSNTVVPVIEFVAALLNGEFNDSMAGAGNAVGGLGGIVQSIFTFIVSFVNARIREVVAVAGLIGDFVAAVRSHFNAVRDAISDRIDAAVSFVKELPGRILDAIGDLGSLLFDAGKSVIQGLINGINNQIDNLKGKMSDVASTITDYLPFSPAKEGPLSGAGSPDRSGASIARMIGEGLDSETDFLRRSTSGFMSELRSLIDADAGSFGTAGIPAATTDALAQTPLGQGGPRSFNIENLHMDVVDHDMPLNEMMRHLEMMGAR